jgi:eukaryotic translation initiation factor 2C
MNLAYLELEEERSRDTDNDDGQGDDTHPPGMPLDLPKIDDKKISKAEKLREEKRQEEDQASQLESHLNNVPLNLTFIIVGKRHNTRLYPVRISGHITPPNSDGPRPNANVRPGLVVDQVITHPYSMGFYPQSHHPIQGTGRSAHYIVLRNNIGLSVDELQRITHTFCYAYAILRSRVLR